MQQKSKTLTRKQATAKKAVRKPRVHTPKNVGFWQHVWGTFTTWTVRTHFWRRLLLGVIALAILVLSGMYGIAQWYIHKHRNEPIVYGATFVPGYARYFDLDATETLTAMLKDLGLKRLRLVSYWDDIEATKGTYDFRELDSEMALANKYGAEVSLSIGLRQPRWPECHMPTWAQSEVTAEWEPQLNKFIGAVVSRYKDNPALVSYQLENEFLLNVFGVCTNFDRKRLVSEFNLVKSIDPNHPLIVNRSNNAVPSWPVGEPRADEVGAAVYKRVWDKTVTQRYFEYPLPAWFYSFLAGGTELTTGRNSFIHELQTEPWVADNLGGIKYASTAEQDKSFDAGRLKSRIEYAEATGMKTIDFWGVEWWYWRLKKFDDPSLWNIAKQGIQKAEAHNQKLRESGKLQPNLDVLKK